MNGKAQALALIRQRKKLAEETYSSNMESLCSDPVFDELIRKETVLKWDYVKSSSEQEREKISVSISDIRNQIKEHMINKGLPLSLLSVPYNCKFCNDTGFIDGKECSCVERQRISMELTDNPLLKNVPPSLSKIDFSFYGTEKTNKIKCAECIADGIKNGKTIFLIAGKTGTAKTYIAATAVKEELLKGKSVLALSAVKLGKSFLEYHCAPIEEKTAKFNSLSQPDVLLIDDLGAEQMLNNVTVPYLIELLTEREEEKLTFITTNLLPEELENRYGQRVLSRILNKKLSLPVLLNGRDLRINI